MRLAQPGPEISGGERPANMIALGIVTTHAREEVERAVILHTFRHDFQSKAVPQICDRADDEDVALIHVHVLHKRPIDLDLIDREPLEMGERGVAGAEVVDRDSYTHVAQTTE